MRDKLSPGIDKAGKSAETLGDKAEQVSKSITDRIAAQKEQIKYVESCLKDLKKQYDNLAPGKAQLEMRAEIDACTKALQEDNRCNVLCMGHMASDSIGFNQILDAWEAAGLEVTRTGGIVR